MSKKYYYLKKGELVKDNDEVQIYGEIYTKCKSTVGTVVCKNEERLFRREIIETKNIKMKKNTKISKLREHLLRGYVISPLSAWNNWRMAQNTFNRQLWELRHNHGLQIESRQIIGINNERYNIHWIEKENLKNV